MYKLEVERLHQIYYDARMELLELEPNGQELVFDVDVDLIMDVKDRIQTILDPVKKEADAVRTIFQHRMAVSICDNYIISNFFFSKMLSLIMFFFPKVKTHDAILAGRIYEIQDLKQATYNRLYALGCRVSTALKIVQKMRDLETDYELGGFLSSTVIQFFFWEFLSTFQPT